MQRLILFRHAKAERGAPGGEDYDRGLTDRGRADARLMGRVLAEAGLKPDFALVSAARRTCETWAEAAPSFGDVEAVFDRKLYHAGSSALRAAVEAADGRGDTIMLVGHNPGIQQLAIELLVEGAASPTLIGQARDKFPTSAVAVFAVDVAGRPTYDGLLYAKEYGGGAEE